MNTTSFDPNRSVASLTLAELEAFIKQTIQQTEQSPPKYLISALAELDTPFDASAPPFWQVIASHTAQIPDEVWATIPEDASEQVDHYLYHS